MPRLSIAVELITTNESTMEDLAAQLKTIVCKIENGDTKIEIRNKKNGYSCEVFVYEYSEKADIEYMEEIIND